MKLVSKVRIGSRYRKRYDKPQTPFQCLLDSEILFPEQIKKLHNAQSVLKSARLKTGNRRKTPGYF